MGAERNRNMVLQGKSVVVTGASSGMGRAIASLFVKEGADVLAVARRRERLDELAAEVKGEPGRLLPFVGDVSRREDNEAMIDAALREFGRLDVLVNNAGIMDDMAPVGEFTDEKLLRVFAVNTFGPACAMRKAVRVFLQQGHGGNIINVASVGALRSCAGAVYCASKAALVSMTKNTAFMYQPQGIRCNAIAPGGINTEISVSMGVPNENGYGRIKTLLPAAPAPGEGEDIAAAALFLASDASRYVSGDVMVVDGGWIAG